MTPTDDRQLPSALAAVAAITFDYADGEGVDFEPYPAFWSADETTEWIRAWTGNRGLTGEEWRVFGMDGTGGQGAFWLTRLNRPLSDQPIVFLGSEGETGAVARDLHSFLWLLADGMGPYEAINPRQRDRAPRPNPELAAIAERFAPAARQSAATVISLAIEEFPAFDEMIKERCR
ncbi:SMI1/KNR4 family protein [Streptacidiphilus sp. N1-10]|uniref:SMI1/KNR4 family protein n=1 Tax=Streptacidiphilus jeojiensis TaxID=3229225 RepID=A0ABV6XY29_9ACTN